MNKLTVFVFIPTLKSGGAEKQAVLLSKYLKSEYEVYLIVWNGQLFEQKFLDFIDLNKIQTYYICGNLLTRIFQFYKLLKKHKVDFIFNYLASNNFYGSIIGKLAGVKHIIGGIRNAEIPFTKYILQKFLHNYLLEFTIFNNYSGCENLSKKGFNLKKSIVIPNCFELNINYIERTKKDIIQIVSLARFVPQKDYETALLAIQYLKENIFNNTNIHFKYLIIGYGEQESQIKNLINKYQLETVCEILINPINSLDYVKESDIFLTTSLFEGTSNSVMEAMSFSLPIVSTDAGDNKYLVEDNKNGFITPIKDYKEIAIGLSKLIDNYNLRIQFGKYSYEKLKKDYTGEIFKKRYIDFINKNI
jgi:glycosyltransferase involved in cell wall biosynthesis